MNPEPVLLLGAGGHAAACIDVIEAAGRFRIAGLIGLLEERGREVLGYPVIGADSDLPAVVAEYPNVVVTAGQIKSPDVRIRLFTAAEALGATFPVIVSPHARLSPHADVGAGSIIMHGAVVNAGARIGRNCIVNSQSLVEHGCVVGDHTHISTGARLNSGVTVGSGTFIGSGTGVRQLVRIGDHCVIGMGLTVLMDCPSGTHLPQRRGEP